MQTLISMEYTPSEAKKETIEAQENEAPKYPWGLSINLDEETLAKLGIDTLPEVGATMAIVARSEVSSASQYQDQGDKSPRKSLTLQITDMSVTPVAADIAGALYNGK